MSGRVESRFGLLGTGIHHGQRESGVSKGYQHLEQMGFWKKISEEFDFHDFGYMEKTDIDKAYNHLFHKTLEIIDLGFKPFLLGGDHSQSFASISAIHGKYPDLRILWFDAHADMNTPHTSPSDNTHGMPLAGLLGLVDKNKWAMPWMDQTLKPDQVVQLGVRDIDEGEMELMEEHGIEYYSPEQIRDRGLKNILGELSKRWESLPLHLSFDIDGLDSSLVPSTTTPVPGGLHMDEAGVIIESCKTQFDLVSCEVVEFNPSLEDSTKLSITENSMKEIIEMILS